MNFIFAQIPTASETEIGKWVIGLLAFLVLVDRIIQIFINVRGRPSSEQLQSHYDELAQRVKNLEVKFDQERIDNQKNYASLIEAGEERARLLHERLNPVTEKLSHIEGAFTAWQQSFQQFIRLMEANR